MAAIPNGSHVPGWFQELEKAERVDAVMAEENGADNRQLATLALQAPLSVSKASSGGVPELHTARAPQDAVLRPAMAAEFSLSQCKPTALPQVGGNIISFPICWPEYF
jgi:hypothetical protein